MSHVLRSSPASPFGRKVKIAAHVTGVSDTMEVVMTNTTDPADPIRQQNPLGKIPALVLENGPVLYDSRVILEWVDVAAKKRGHEGIIPQDEEARFAALTLQALADGLMDAALLQVYEKRLRPEDMQSASWLAHQAGKVERALGVAEASCSQHPVTERPVHVGQIALACALGYLDLRFPSFDWRTAHPGLAGWLKDFARLVPAFDKTRAEA